MKAWVYVNNYGTEQEVRFLCDTINTLTMYHAYVTEFGNVAIGCRLGELGDLLNTLASSDATNWIEYTVNFEV